MLTAAKDEMVSSQRFVLYLKVREITAVNKALQGALKLPLNEQKRWAEENGQILDTALNAFIDDTNVILEKISLDDEILDLSEKLVVGLRKAVQNIDKLLGPQEELES
ncbi:MAG: hypothetical protein BroJett025_09680 [Patescibacteria group bacterium]|nr:MAG: hypothetical protein BroJett025_09680 [Patescibacteria group bacterium]